MDSEDSDQTGWMPSLICLRWVHRSLCWFCRAAALSHILEFIKLKTFFEEEKRFLPTDPSLFDRVG